MKPRKTIPFENTTFKSDVYKITCSNCPTFFTGHRRCLYDKHFKDYLPRFTINEQKSYFAKHVKDYNHTYTNIHSCKKYHLLSSLEEYQFYAAIKHNPNNN